MGKCFSRDQNKGSDEDGANSGTSALLGKANGRKQKDEDTNLDNARGSRDGRKTSAKRLQDASDTQLPGISISNEIDNAHNAAGDRAATLNVPDIKVALKDGARSPASPSRRKAGASPNAGVPPPVPVIVSAAPFLRRIEFSKDYVGIQCAHTTDSWATNLIAETDAKPQPQKGSRSGGAPNAWMLPENFQSMLIWVCACGPDTEHERQALQHAFYGDAASDHDNDAESSADGKSVSRQIREQYGLDPCLIDWKLGLPQSEYDQVYKRTALPFLHEMQQWKDHVVILILDSQRYSSLFEDEVRYVLDHFQQAQLFMVQRIFFNPPSLAKPLNQRSAAEQLYFMFTADSSNNNTNGSSSSNNKFDAPEPLQATSATFAASQQSMNSADARHNAHAQLCDDLSRVIAIERQYVYRLKFDPLPAAGNDAFVRATLQEDFMQPLLLACRKMAERSAQFVLDAIYEHQQPRNYNQTSRRIYSHVFTHWYRMKALLLSRLGRAHVVSNADDGFQQCAGMMQIKNYLLSTSPLYMPLSTTQNSTSPTPASPTNATTITTERRQSKVPNSLISTLLASSTATIAAGTAGFGAASGGSAAGNAGHSYYKPLLVLPEKLLNLLPPKTGLSPTSPTDAGHGSDSQKLLLQSAQLAVEKRLCSLLLAETVQLYRFLLLLPTSTTGREEISQKNSDAVSEEEKITASTPHIIFRFRLNHRESLLELLWSIFEQIITTFKLSNKVSADLFLNLLLRQRTATTTADPVDTNIFNDPYWPIRNALQEVLNQISLQVDASKNNDSTDDFHTTTAGGSGGLLPVVIIILDNIPLSVFAGIKLISPRIRVILSPPIHTALNEQHVHNCNDRFFLHPAAAGEKILLQHYFCVLPISLQSFSGNGAAGLFSSKAVNTSPLVPTGLDKSLSSLWSSTQSISRETFSEAVLNVYKVTQPKLSGNNTDTITPAIAKSIIKMQDLTPESVSTAEHDVKVKLRRAVLASFATRLTLSLTLQELQTIMFEHQFHRGEQHLKSSSTSTSAESLLNWRRVNQLLLDTLQQLEEQGFIVYTLSTWRDQLVYLLTDWSYDLLRRQHIVLPDAVDRLQQHESSQRKASAVSITGRKSSGAGGVDISSSSGSVPHSPSFPYYSVLTHRQRLTDVETQILTAFAASIDRPSLAVDGGAIIATTTKSISLIIKLIQQLALDGCSAGARQQRGISTTLMSNDSQLSVHFLMLAIEALINLGQQYVSIFSKKQQTRRRKSSVASLLMPAVSSPPTTATNNTNAVDVVDVVGLQNDDRLFLSAICCSLPALANEPAQLAVQLYHRLNKLKSSADDLTSSTASLLAASALLDRLKGSESLSLPYLSQSDCLLDPMLLYDASGNVKHGTGGGGGDAATVYNKRKHSVAKLNTLQQHQQQQVEFIKPSMVRCIPFASSVSATGEEDADDVCRDLVLIMNEEKGYVAVYDYKRNVLVRQIYGIDRPKDVKFLDSDRCVILSNREMKIYSLKQGVQVGHLKGVMNQTLPYFAVQNEAFIVALSRNRMYVNMFDVESGSVKTTFKAGEDRFLNSLVVSRNGDKMVCGDETQKPFPLLVWDLNERRLLHDLRMANHEFLTQLMAIDDQGYFFACVCEEISGPEPNFIVVYDVQHGTLYKKWKPGAPTTALAIASATQRVVVAAQNCGLYIYDLLAGSCKHVLFMHNYPATNLRISDDGRRALTWSARENCLRIWDIMGGQYLGGFTPDEEISCAEINHDGTFVIFACQMYINCSGVAAAGDATKTGSGYAACFAVSTNKQARQSSGDVSQARYGAGEQFVDLRTVAHKQLMEHGTESAV